MKISSRIVEQLTSRVERVPNGCLVWTGRRDSDGYVPLWIDGKTYRGHRVIFELERGPIPDGMCLDHLCHTADQACPGGLDCIHRACLDASHLEVVTPGENTRRGGRRLTECVHGHPLDEANTYVHPSGSRSCRTCRDRASREYRARRRQLAQGRA